MQLHEYPMKFLLFPVACILSVVATVIACCNSNNSNKSPANFLCQMFIGVRTMSRDEIVLLLSSAIDFLSDSSLPSELTTISTKLADYRQQFHSITGYWTCVHFHYIMLLLFFWTNVCI